jgi:hypothetical protein
MAIFPAWGGVHNWAARTRGGEHVLPVRLHDAFGGAHPPPDAFGRLRVSEPLTLFDSKQIHDNAPLYWDDQEVSGSGTSSTHSTARASSMLAVADATAGRRLRRTRQRFNYQPGKSMLILMTGVLQASGGGAGITSRIGYYDDNNGFRFQMKDGTMSVVRRSKVTGSVVDTVVEQSAWNVDPLDGTGPSGVTIDPETSLIYWIDMEWLGVGSVRMGVVVDGAFLLCHIFHHANSISGVYMSTPNLPVSYEIQNDGTGAASEMEHICATVVSEGGQEKLGRLFYASNGATHVDANSSGTVYALLGIRLKATALDEMVELVGNTVMASTSDNYEWQVRFNPTVAGTFTYASANSASSVEVATGATANTVTGGTVMDGGYVKSAVASGSTSSALENAVRLGSSIGGTPDTIVLCARPLAGNADIYGSLTWRESS